MALSPWSIVFSREEIVQRTDSLPLCTTLFCSAVARAAGQEGRSRGFLAGHHRHGSNAAAFLGVDSRRRRVRCRSRFPPLDWRWRSGVAVGVLSYLPVHHFSRRINRPYGLTTSRLACRAWSGGADRERSLGFMVDITGGGGMGFLLGRSSLLPPLLSCVIGVSALAGIVAFARNGSEGGRRLGVVYVIWFLMPLLVLTALPVRPYIHYFIVLLPLPFFGIAYLLELAGRRRHFLRVCALAGIVVCFVLVDARFYLEPSSTTAAHSATTGLRTSTSGTLFLTCCITRAPATSGSASTST